MEEKQSRLEEFLEQVQSASDSQKKRWLVLSVGLISIVVIFLWTVNFRFMMSGYTTQVVVGDASDSPSLFARIGHGFSQGIHAMGDAIAAQREDIVTPSQ